MQNLLFITIDDFMSLSAWPIYDDVAITPNMDALMGTSANFSSAFADVALCNPSRAAILTGQTPWQTGVLTNTQDLRHHVDLATETLPGILKAAGMYTAVGGKVFHTFPSDQRDAVADEVLNSSGLRNSSSSEFGSVVGTSYGTTDIELSDDVLVDSANAFMAAYDSDEPFALFAGIYRPHADWIVPQEYLDLYADVSIPLPDFVDDSDRAEFLSALSRPFHEEVLSSGAWEDLVRHYLASLSYADAKLGELMEGLQESGHFDDTITVVMSDHGYHLGDASLWHKFTTYEQSSRAPLMISIPGQEAQQINVPVNLSGVTATVLELLGLDVPDQMQPSLVPLLEGEAPTGEEFALTWMNGSVSVRTANYRYTLYENGEEELFDIDADIMNTDNLIEDLPEIAAALRLLADDAIGDGLFIRPDGPVSGGDEDTTYYLHTSVVDITDSGGEDTVYVASDYTLQADLENLHAIDTDHGLVLTGNGGANRISGALDDDTLIGRAGADNLFGAAGDDLIDGGAGNDFLSGGPGDDIVEGGSGHDQLEGNFGNDTLFGGGGKDIIDGASGNDFLYGNDDHDMLYGSSGNDRLEGGNGNDLLDGGLGWDTILGGSGVDTAIFAGESRDFAVYSGDAASFRVDGPDGRDTLTSIEYLQFDDVTLTVSDFFITPAPEVRIGGDGDDVFETGRGDDLVTGRKGDDEMHTYGGEDILTGGGGDDMLDGGAGIDTASYQSATGSVEVYLNFGLAMGAQGADRLQNIENLIGGQYDDRLVGNDGANQLDGGRGDDFFKGHDGKDLINGGQGNDHMEGGGADDTLNGNTGDDYLDGGGSDDILNGGGGNDYLLGSDGEDQLFGGDGNDILFGGADDDYLEGSTGDDLLRGNKGEDRLLGGMGNDNIRGGDGDDIIRGEGGNDALFGEAGSDILHGNNGDDVLFGGRGGGEFDETTDMFVFGLTSMGFGGFDRIKDFENDIDKLDLTRFDFDDFETDILPLAYERGDGKDMALIFEEGYVVYIDNFTLLEFDISDVML
ncbi:MAG: sulfatase-like hydrolase/transferase [Aliishimia sp.]